MTLGRGPARSSVEKVALNLDLGESQGEGEEIPGGSRKQVRWERWPIITHSLYLFFSGSMEMLANNQHEQKLVMGLNELRILILKTLVKMLLILKYFCFPGNKETWFSP